ncbi:MAG: RidA family protein [Chromatiales bacterium]|jgi:enamine deaminase RidA (YjgF/YER057c/UK114 family)|nr:RidA family protein [Chromatiales bacterium]
MDFLKPESWPRAPGFSWGVSGTGRTVFVAGQVGRDPAGDGTTVEGFGPQTAQAFANIAEVLASAGASATDVAHMTWYVTDIKRYREAGQEISTAYKATFGRHFPSMTMVQVVGLLDPNALVEIECFAVVEGG